ncbi:hypothetical protein WJX81_005545 [Elliptochloris bilobata]|uniref:DET1- and DDB1-associated protein 1 n=1 Tax=Elliptochloris bilobata TaxID=381761 RepID=A0AAW1RCR7_9CHLO
MADGVLLNLPSRGLLKCAAGAALVGKAPKTYVADHSTDPAQVVENDPSNVLVAALLQKRDRDADARRATDRVRAADKGKRPAEPGAAERPAKRSGCAAPEAGSSRHAEGEPSGSGVRGAGAHLSGEELRAKTIPELLELLRARGLPTTRGKKEELVQRLLCSRPRSARPG